MDTLELLKEARHKVEHHWQKDSKGYGGWHLLTGEPMTCAVGAIGWVADGADYGVGLRAMDAMFEAEREAVEALWDSLPTKFRRGSSYGRSFNGMMTDVEDYNDHVGIEKGAILALYDAAIERVQNKS